MLLLTELAFGALPEYEIIDLFVLPGGNESRSLSINNLGRVVKVYARAGIGRKAVHKKTFYYRNFYKNCLAKGNF